jgi:hypothetical protein
MMGVYTGLIDSGYRTKGTSGIYDFCMKSGGLFVPSKGFPESSGIQLPASEETTEYLGQEIPFVKYRDDMLKDVLYQQTIRHTAGAGWYLPLNIDEIYRSQLTDEKVVEEINKKTGREESFYKSGNNNHLADCEKMQFALREILIKPLIAVKNAQKLREEQKLKEPKREGDRVTREYTLR